MTSVVGRSLPSSRGGAIVRTSLLILGVLVLFMPSVARFARAEEPELLLPGPGGYPADIDREVLWLDNPDFASNVATSEVISAFDLWSETANDFMLEMDATIRKVTWWDRYWYDFNGTPTGAGFSLRFYNDTGRLITDFPLALRFSIGIPPHAVANDSPDQRQLEFLVTRRRAPPCFSQNGRDASDAHVRFDPMITCSPTLVISRLGIGGLSARPNAWTLVFIPH